MQYDVTSLRWTADQDDTSAASHLLRGHDLAADPLPLPPGEVWGTLRFRAWRDNDAAVYAQLLSDPSIWKFMPHDSPGTIDIDHARSLITIAQENQRHLVRAVIRNDVPVGQVRLHWKGSPKPMSMVELDYWLDKTAQGTGVGTRMVALFLSQALRDFPYLQMVTVVIHRDNGPSRALARRLGFVETMLTDPEGPWIQACLTRRNAAQLDWGGLVRRKTERAGVASA